jgi:hypothetical protein
MVKIGVIVFGVIWLLLLAGVMVAAMRQIDASGRRR